VGFISSPVIWGEGSTWKRQCKVEVPGLTSMEERVRLVNGTISVDSKPLGGTSIHVRVPLESKPDSQRQAV